MLDRYLNALLLNMCRAEEFHLPELPDDPASWADVTQETGMRLLHEADALLAAPIPALPATEYMRYKREGAAENYVAAYETRRAWLKTLTLACRISAETRYWDRLIDLIWAICEESTWILPMNNPYGMSDIELALPEVSEPLVDLAAADTADDLTAACLLLGSRFAEVAPQLVRRVEWEVEGRIIAPFLSCDGMSWMCGPKGEAPRCLSGAMLAIFAFERDGRRRWHAVRKAWLLLDKLLAQLPPDGSVPGGIGAWLDVAAPVMDMLSMAACASEGKADARREAMAQYLCHFPVFCHIAEGWFINPGQCTLRPALDGVAMYRIGLAVKDAALCDLGAFLCQRRRAEPDGRQLLLHAAFDVRNRDRIERAQVHPPFRAQGYLSAMELMTVRIREDEQKGLALAMLGGHNGALNGHADVGDFMLFAGGRPVFVDAGCFADSQFHNLPMVGESEQAFGANYRAVDVICRLEHDYAMMSMSLAGAYPEQSGIYAWQRSAILSRTDGVAQLIDVFDLKAPAPVRFHFITPICPTLGPLYALIGPVRLRWEAGLSAETDELPVSGAEYAAQWGETLYRLTLITDEAVTRGKYTFTMNALRTFGS